VTAMQAETLVRNLAGYTALAVEGTAVLLIAYGAVETFLSLAARLLSRAAAAGWRKGLFVRFGMWLLLGLQFALAADIVRSVISPSWNDIGQLAAIALIRTFLNHFLERDLEEASQTETGNPVAA
jgi:uncharacterized membrane protein